MMNDTVDPLYEQVYSLTAGLLDANVNEGNSLEAKLSAMSIIFLDCDCCNDCICHDAGNENGQFHCKGYRSTTW